MSTTALVVLSSSSCMNNATGASSRSFPPRSKSEGDLLLHKKFTLQADEENQATRPPSIDHHLIDVDSDDHLIHPNVAHRDTAGGSTDIMKYLVFALLALVSILYQGKADVLMSDYPFQFWCLIVAVCIYWAIMKFLAVSISHLILSECDYNTLKGIALACEVVAVFSLVSVLLPPDISILVFYAFMYSTAVSVAGALTQIYCFRTQNSSSTPRHTSLSS